MAHIRVKMSSGDEFTISNAFYGKDGAMDLSDARVQASFLLTKMASVTSDQGAVVNTAQISHFWIQG